MELFFNNFFYSKKLLQTLKLEFMGVNSVSKLEIRAKVWEEDLLFGMFSNHVKHLFVEILLIRFALVRGLVSLLLLCEHIRISRFLLFSFSFHFEISVIDILWYLHSRDVQFGAGDNHKLLMHSSEGALVDGEGAIDEQKSRSELFEKHDTLTTVTSGENNQHSAWLDAWKTEITVNKGFECLDGTDLVWGFACGLWMGWCPTSSSWIAAQWDSIWLSCVGRHVVLRHSCHHRSSSRQIEVCEPKG